MLDEYPRPPLPRMLGRGEGDFFPGGYTLNFVAVELLIVLILLVGFLVSWPTVPWDVLLWDHDRPRVS